MVAAQCHLSCVFPLHYGIYLLLAIKAGDIEGVYDHGQSITLDG